MSRISMSGGAAITRPVYENKKWDMSSTLESSTPKDNKNLVWEQLWTLDIEGYPVDIKTGLPRVYYEKDADGKLILSDGKPVKIENYTKESCYGTYYDTDEIYCKEINDVIEGTDPSLEAVITVFNKTSGKTSAQDVKKMINNISPGKALQILHLLEFYKNKITDVVQSVAEWMKFKGINSEKRQSKILTTFVKTGKTELEGEYTELAEQKNLLSDANILLEKEKQNLIKMTHAWKNRYDADTLHLQNLLDNQNLLSADQTIEKNELQQQIDTINKTNDKLQKGINAARENEAAVEHAQSSLNIKKTDWEEMQRLFPIKDVSAENLKLYDDAKKKYDLSAQRYSAAANNVITQHAKNKPILGGIDSMVGGYRQNHYGGASALKYEFPVINATLRLYLEGLVFVVNSFNKDMKTFKRATSSSINKPFEASKFVQALAQRNIHLYTENADSKDDDDKNEEKWEKLRKEAKNRFLSNDRNFRPGLDIRNTPFGRGNITPYVFMNIQGRGQYGGGDFEEVVKEIKTKSPKLACTNGILTIGQRTIAQLESLQYVMDERDITAFKEKLEALHTAEKNVNDFVEKIVHATKTLEISGKRGNGEKIPTDKLTELAAGYEDAVKKYNNKSAPMQTIIDMMNELIAAAKSNRGDDLIPV